MKIIKLGLISVFILSLILFLISLLIPSQVRISRAINVDASRESILPRLTNTKNWKEWNELVNDTVQITIIATSPGMITTSWKNKGEPLASGFTLEQSGGVTVVQWYFDIRLKWYPWQKFGSIIFDKQLGPPMEKSLNNLKKLVENSP